MTLHVRMTLHVKIASRLVTLKLLALLVCANALPPLLIIEQSSKWVKLKWDRRIESATGCGRGAPAFCLRFLPRHV
jgi:hypothetical protein